MPNRHWAITGTNDDLLSIWPLRTICGETWIQWLSKKKMHFKMSSAKCRSLCWGPNLFTFGTHAPHCFTPIPPERPSCWQQSRCCARHNGGVHATSEPWLPSERQMGRCMTMDYAGTAGTGKLTFAWECIILMSVIWLTQLTLIPHKCASEWGQLWFR